MRPVFHPETNGVKASPHRLKWMLSRGALAAPSDPWNFDASDVPPPALQRLLADVKTRKVDVIVVYKVDRLTRSLADFASS